MSLGAQLYPSIALTTISYYHGGTWHAESPLSSSLPGALGPQSTHRSATVNGQAMIHPCLLPPDGVGINKAIRPKSFSIWHLCSMLGRSPSHSQPDWTPQGYRGSFFERKSISARGPGEARDTGVWWPPLRV